MKIDRCTCLGPDPDSYRDYQGRDFLFNRGIQIALS